VVATLLRAASLPRAMQLNLHRYIREFTKCPGLACACHRTSGYPPCPQGLSGSSASLGAHALRSWLHLMSWPPIREQAVPQLHVRPDGHFRRAVAGEVRFVSFAGARGG
jgi:hypothetical protein